MDLPSPNRLHNNARPTRKGHNFINKTLKLLSEYAYVSDMRFRHYSIICKGGKILGQGASSFKSHNMPRIPILLGESNRELDCILTLHSEMAAILSVKNKSNLKGASLFVARVSRLHGVRMSCPCESCEYYIRKYGIKKVLYSTDNGWYEVRIY